MDPIGVCYRILLSGDKQFLVHTHKKQNKLFEANGNKSKLVRLIPYCDEFWYYWINIKLHLSQDLTPEFYGCFLYL